MEALNREMNLLLIIPPITSHRSKDFPSLNHAYRWPTPYYPLMVLDSVGFLDDTQFVSCVRYNDDFFREKKSERSIA